VSYNVLKSKRIAAVSMLAIQAAMISAMVPAAAHADSISDLKVELNIIQSQIKDMQAQEHTYSPEKRDELAQVKAEVAQLKAQLAVAQTPPPPATPIATAATPTSTAIYPYTNVLPATPHNLGSLFNGGTGPLSPPVAKPVVGGILLYAGNGSAFFIDGDIDAGLRLDSGAGHSLLSVQSGLMRASRLTLEGYQNIGFGLRAVGVIEGGFNVAQGTGASNPDGITGFAFGRESFVGIGNDKYGYIDYGRQYSPIWAVSAAPVAEPFAGNYLGGIVALDPTLAVNSRVSNAITYNYRYTWEGMLDPSPSKGLGFAAMYAPGGANGATTGTPISAGQQFGASASYGTKHWWLGAGYHQIDGINLSDGDAPFSNTFIPTLPDTQKTRLVEVTVAGSYLTPFARLFAQFNVQENGRKNALDDAVDQHDWMVGAVVPTFKHQNLRFSYGTLYNETSTKAQYSVAQASYEYDLVQVPGTALYLEGALVANNKRSAQGLLGAQDVGGTGPSAILPTQLSRNGTALDYGATASTIATGIRFIF
jgi:predicted porin